MRTHRNYRPPSGWSCSTLALLLLIAGAVTDTALGQPAGYRDWVSTTFPEPVPIARQYPSDFPVGVYFYTYYDAAIDNVWDYISSIGADYIIRSVEKGNYIYPRWPQYQTLIDSAPAGKRIVPWVSYVGHANRPSYLDQGSSSREALFYFYDTSELRALRYFTDVFTVFSWDDNVFTHLAEPDSMTINLEPGNAFDGHAPREVIYKVNGSATNPIASGIAFGWDSTQTERWNQTWNGSSWQSTSNPINSSQLFEGIDWAKPDPDNPGGYTWQKWRTFRSPHYIVVKGHLFPEGEALNKDTLLIIRVYYEIDKGKTYRDSNNILHTAEANLRFLYKQFPIVKSDFLPRSPMIANWNEYREVVRNVNFSGEGMGGPSDPEATAHRFDIEVHFTGAETLALRSLAVRDSIAHMLQSAEGEGFRAGLLAEIIALKNIIPAPVLLSSFSTPLLRPFLETVLGTDWLQAADKGVKCTQTK